MPKYDDNTRTAALAEITDAAKTVRELTEQLAAARATAVETVVRHLHDRSAPPAEITARSPFDSSEVRALGVAAGVPETHLPRAPRASGRPMPVRKKPVFSDAFSSRSRSLAALDDSAAPAV